MGCGITCRIPSKKVIMRSKLYICLIVCLLAPFGVFSQVESGVQNVIKLNKDFTFVVGEMFPTAKLYGDDAFDNNYAEDTKSLNKDIKGVEFFREDGRAKVRIKHNEIGDEPFIVKFYAAKLNQNGFWGKDEANKLELRFVKIISESEVGDNENFSQNGTHGSDLSSTSNSVMQDIDLKHELARLDERVFDLESINTSEFPLWPIILSCIVAALLALWILRLNYKINSFQKELEKNLSAKEENTKLKEVVKATHIPNNPVMSKTEIETIIDAKIKKMLEEKAISAVEERSHPSEQPVVKQSETAFSIDTIDVKFNQADNSFTIEKTDMHIWRIYSKDDAFFYTIVEDDSIREGMATSIETFKGCISYFSSDQLAQRIEPVLDGRLKKLGDKFYVDESNKLEVKFV